MCGFMPDRCKIYAGYKIPKYARIVAWSESQYQDHSTSEAISFERFVHATKGKYIYSHV